MERSEHMLEPTDNDTTTHSDGGPTTGETGSANTASGTAAPVKAAKKTAKKAAKKAVKKAAPRAAKKATAEQATATADSADGPAAAGKATATAVKATRKRTAKKAAPAAETTAEPGADAAADTPAPAKATRKRTAKKIAQPPAATEMPADSVTETAAAGAAGSAPALAASAVLFVPPSEPQTRAPRKRAAKKAAPIPEPAPAEADIARAEDVEDGVAEPDDVREAAVEEATGARRRRRRGRRGRGGAGTGGSAGTADDQGDDAAPAPPVLSVPLAADGTEAAESAETTDDDLGEGADAAEGADGGATGTKRRRRRRRSGGNGAEAGDDDPPNTVVHVRESRGRGSDRSDRADRADRADSDDDGVKGVKGSTRLEAKRQRRRDGRETSRRRPPILTESEFLARREAVDRVMAVRQTGDRTQIAVLEDDILVEHYVTRASATSYVGNVYLGRVQNVLPSMEAAFIDIAKGRNGVLYAGEVNWDAAGLEGKSRAIEQALKSGDVVLVQVTKDPIGHKGARLTSQVSLPGRFLVYVPGGGMTGISRKLPDTERHRLKAILKKIVPEDAGVIVRTAAEGASEEDLTRDVERLKAQWEIISKKAEKTSSAPTLVHGEPDLAIRVVRDVFNEDFKRLIVQGDDAWATVSEYVEGVAPDLGERVSKHTSERDLFAELRVDEQLMKALDRKVYLPSGGSLVIDRTEAMTVIDVNTGKFVGSGGNLEQTVTRNNLEAAEEIVRQLRLRDVGGIVVIDFIDMVLESNRDLVLRRLTECLGRDRTKHQVAEVTSLGLVQMTRKRVGEGLLEAFSEPCEHCRGRGVILHTEPVDRQHAPAVADDDEQPKTRRKRGAKKDVPTTEADLAAVEEQRKAARAAITAIHRAAHPDDVDGGVDGHADVFADSDADSVGDSDADSDLLDTPVGEIETVAPGLAAEVATTVLDAEARGEAAESEPSAEPPAEPAPPASRPRRRRAASRPAGPPVAVGQH